MRGLFANSDIYICACSRWDISKVLKSTGILKYLCCTIDIIPLIIQVQHLINLHIKYIKLNSSNLENYIYT